LPVVRGQSQRQGVLATNHGQLTTDNHPLIAIQQRKKFGA
jgi:hypothetical protein